jgi:DNA repair protein RecO (recombination protein O)
LRQSIVTPAVVLRRVAYGEADLIVTLLGLATGRVSALAKSARKSTRRFAGGLGIGMSGEATLRDRQSAELMMLEGFDAGVDRPSFATDLAKSAHAAYALELCDRLCPTRHPEPAVFRWLEELLSRLDGGVATAERLRVFELGLLRALGMGPSINRCAACGRNDLGDETTRWLPHAGGVFCQRCAKIGDLVTAATRNALEALSAATLAEADVISLGKGVATECRRAVLALIREHVHGPLRSLDFIEKMSGASLKWEPW